MTHDLPQIFEGFVRGASTPGAFECQLLTLCKTTPESTWDVLALLDQHHRRGKLSAELCRTIRHKIERQVLGIENFEMTRAPAAREPDLPPAAAPIPIEPIARAEVAPRPEPPKIVKGRQQIRTSQAVALSAVLLGIVASPAVTELPRNVDTAHDVASASQAPDQRTSGPELISLASDQYVVYPNERMGELSVQRTLEAGGDTSFVWWTKGSGAKPNEDYIAGPPKLAQMREGVASVKLYVPILANPSRRHIEMFYVLIGKPGGGAGLGPIRRAAVFIMPANRADGTVAAAPSATSPGR